MSQRSICVSVLITLAALTGKGNAQNQASIALDRFAFDPPMVIEFDPKSTELLPASLAAFRGGAADATRLPVAVGVVNGVWTVRNEAVPGQADLVPASAPHRFPGEDGQRSHVAAADADGDGRDEVFCLSPAPATNPSTSSTLSIGSVRGEPGIRRHPPNVDLGPGLRDLAAHGDAVVLATGRTRGWATAVAVGGSRAVIVDCRRSKDRGPFELTITQELTLPGNAIAVERVLIGGTAFFAVLGDFDVDGSTRPAVLSLSPIGGGQFVAGPPLAIGAQSVEAATCLAVGDLNGNGDPEVVAGLASFDALTLDRGRVLALEPAVEFDAVGNAKLVLVPTEASVGTRATPTALAVGDFGPTGPTGSDGIADVAVAGIASKQGATLDIVPGTSAGGFSDPERVRLSVDGATLPTTWTTELPRFADPFADMITGHFNADGIPDLLLADPLGNRLVVLEGQPPPVATFVEIAIHGHQGTDSMFGIATPPQVIDDFLEATEELGFLINFERRSRPDLDQLPPIRVITVAGHWSQLTEVGALRHAIGRALWSAGSFLPAPMCHTLLNLPSTSAPDPLCYWSSAVFLLVPVVDSGLLCGEFLGGMDPALIARFLLGGLGFGIEKWGAFDSAAASRTAGDRIALRIDQAVGEARGGMDPCDGLVFAHVSGFSRGATVATRALRRISPLTVRHLAFRAAMHVTHLDAIDPSPVDALRPWARSGFIVLDTLLAPRPGNELVFLAHVSWPTLYDLENYSPDPTLPQDLWYLPLRAAYETVTSAANCLIWLQDPWDLTTEAGKIGFWRDLVGTPVGLARAPVLLTPFPAELQGGVEFWPGTVHEAIDVYWEVLDRDPPGLATAPVSFVETSALGWMSPAGKWEPREDPIPAPHGWLRGVYTRSDPGTEEQRSPVACRANQTGDPFTESPEVTEALAAANDASPFGPFRVRELVPDFDFNVGQGIVANTSALLHGEFGRALPARGRLEQLIPGDDSAPLRSWLLETDAAAFPASGAWRQIDAPASCALNGSGTCVRLEGSGDEQFRAHFSKAVLEPHVHAKADLSQEQDVQKLRTVWAEDLEKTQATAPAAMADRVNTFGRMLSGGTRSGEAWARFPTSMAALECELHSSSLSHDAIWLRVEFDAIAADAALEVYVDGFGDPIVFEPMTNRAQERRLLARTIARSIAERDRVIVRGRNVRVYAVSAKTDGPTTCPVDGVDYELILIDGGTDWLAARAMAERLSWNGKTGQLAKVADPDVIEHLMKLWAIDVPVWLGARGTNGSPASFHWLDGTLVDGPWHANAGFDASDELPGFVYAPPQPEGLGLLSSRVATLRDRRPFGFLVQYR